MKTCLILIAASLGLSACAASLPPTADELAGLPTVRYGQPVTPGRPFVLHYPAGVPLPVTASISGSLLETEGRAELQVSLRRDVWLYKDWVSFDGKHWQRGNELIDSRVALSLPGERDGNAAGSLGAAFDLR